MSAVSAVNPHYDHVPASPSVWNGLAQRTAAERVATLLGVERKSLRDVIAQRLVIDTGRAF